MVTELAQSFFEAVDEKSKEMAGLHKALKSLTASATLEAPKKVQDACRVLEQLDPSAFGLDMEFAGLIAEVRADQQERLKARRIEFGRTLMETAQQTGMTCRMIASDPMEFAIPPFTVVIDLEQNTARMLYARLGLEELPARPERIIPGLQKWVKALEGGWSSEQFFDALHGSYENELFARKERPGDRLAIADLLPRVAFAFQSDRFRSDPVANLYREYGRVRLAYDLSRLRREGVVHRNGWRLNLGTATGSSTQDKKKVLYIEDSPGQGQYYLSIWFSAEG